jgi:hypothetical protein
MAIKSSGHAKTKRAAPKEPDPVVEPSHSARESTGMRALVKNSLSQTALAPTAITAAFAELMNFAGYDQLNEYWLERIFATGGLALAGASAARRAHQRLGAWPVIDHLEGFFAPRVPADLATEAGRAAARARQGELWDDGRPLVWCLGKLEVLGSYALDGTAIEAELADTVAEIVHTLVTEGFVSMAQDLAGGLEALATGEPEPHQRRKLGKPSGVERQRRNGA